MTKKNLSRTEQLALFLGQIQRAEAYLRESCEICEPITHGHPYAGSEIREFEALTARFARLSDLLLQKVLRYIGTIEVGEPGSIIDIMNRAEKQHIATSARDLSEIREIRNEIAHEYATRDIDDLARDVLHWTPILLEITKRVQEYALELTSKLP